MGFQPCQGSQLEKSNLALSDRNPYMFLRSHPRPDLSGALFMEQSGIKKRERRADKGALNKDKRQKAKGKEKRTKKKEERGKNKEKR